MLSPSEKMSPKKVFQFCPRSENLWLPLCDRKIFTDYLKFFKSENQKIEENSHKQRLTFIKKPFQENGKFQFLFFKNQENLIQKNRKTLGNARDA